MTIGIKLYKRSVMGIIVAMAMGATANTVKVTKFHQSYPYSGKATIEYMVVGELPVDAVAEIILNTDDASATFTQKNIVAGANKHEIDFASSFGGALVLTNASFVVTIKKDIQELGGVQLWENGPYWAECNVGATKPEEYGYYFWWGDTVGYTRGGGTLEYNSYSDVTWVSSKGERMTNSPFRSTSSACPTYDKINSALLSAGYIDSTGNLAPAHDAATTHLGSPWRMPTRVEINALINNCTTTWTTKNGVYGRLVTGKGAYADKSIFLPAAGQGGGSYLHFAGSSSYYWSSTPYWDGSRNAWGLDFNSGDFGEQRRSDRYCGQSVRPVREFAK